MTALLWSLLAPFRRALAWAVGGLAVIAGVWFAAKRDAKRDGETDALQRHIDTRKRIDDADIVGDDPAAARRWLSERDPRQP